MVQDWQQVEIKDTNKIKKKWHYHKKALQQDTGIWQIDEKLSEQIRYKIDKAEDSIRRRIRLKRDVQAEKKEYLSANAYQIRLKSSRNITATITAINNSVPSSPYHPNQRKYILYLLSLYTYCFIRNIYKQIQGIGILQKGTLSDLSYDPLDLSAVTPRSDLLNALEDSSLLISPFLKKNEEPVNFSDIPKEEALVTIKEGAFGYLEAKSRNIEKKWRRDCEKIALKGAVYGNIEIVESRYICFSPSQEERPNEPFYRFGALVKTICSFV